LRPQPSALSRINSNGGRSILITEGGLSRGAFRERGKKKKKCGQNSKKREKQAQEPNLGRLKK